MDSSVVHRAARCTPGTGVSGAGRPASFQMVRSLRATERQQPPREVTMCPKRRALEPKGACPHCTGRTED